MAQSVKHLTSTQVMISWFVGSSPASGSVLTAQILTPTLSLSLTLKINKKHAILPFATTWIEQSIMLSEINLRKINTT